MEHTHSFSIFLVTVLVTVSVFIEPASLAGAAQLPEHLPDLATALPPVPTLVPVPPLAPVPPVPPLAPVLPVPPLAPVPPLPPAPLLHPPPLPVLPPTPLPLPPLLPPVVPFVPVPSPPDTPCYPALLTCKSFKDTSDPSQMCCQNMEAVYNNGTDCICKVLKSSELSSDLGLNAADISNLLVECKITDNSISLCASSAPPPSNAKILTAVPSMCTIIVALMYLLSIK